MKLKAPFGHYPMVYQFYLSNIQALLKLKVFKFAHSSFICKESLNVLKSKQKHVNDSTISGRYSAYPRCPSQLYGKRQRQYSNAFYC